MSQPALCDELLDRVRERTMPPIRYGRTIVYYGGKTKQLGLFEYLLFSLKIKGSV